MPHLSGVVLQATLADEDLLDDMQHSGTEAKEKPIRQRGQEVLSALQHRSGLG